jgi:hypothetical protein
MLSKALHYSCQFRRPVWLFQINPYLCHALGYFALQLSMPNNSNVRIPRVVPSFPFLTIIYLQNKNRCCHWLSEILTSYFVLFFQLLVIF